jgi:hypothetical protein
MGCSAIHPSSERRNTIANTDTAVSYKRDDTSVLIKYSRCTGLNQALIIERCEQRSSDSNFEQRFSLGINRRKSHDKPLYVLLPGNAYIGFQFIHCS